MNKKKALYMHELHKSWWICLVGVCMAFIGCFIVWQGTGYGPWFDFSYDYFMGDYGSVSVGSRFSVGLVQTLQIGHHVLVFAVGLMMLLVYMDYHNRKNQEYLHCLPYTKSQRFIARTVLMYIYITICCLVFSLGVIGIRQMEIDNIQYNSLLSPVYQGLLANETIWHTIRSLVLFWLILIALYTVYLMVHNLVNASALASVMTVGVITAPKVLVWTINQYCEIFTGKGMGHYSSLMKLADIFWGNATYVGEGDFIGGYEGAHSVGNSSLMTYVVGYENMLLQYCLMIAVIVVALLIAWKTNKIYDLAKDRMLVSVRWARIAFSVGMGVCFSAPISVATGWMATSAQRMEFSTLGGIVALITLVLIGSGFTALFLMWLRVKVKN